MWKRACLCRDPVTYVELVLFSVPCGSLYFQVGSKSLIESRLVAIKDQVKNPANRTMDQSQDVPASVAAIVVLYHPHEPLLRRLLDSISTQLTLIFVVDNTPNPEPVIAALMETYSTVRYTIMRENLGIAKAQNIGIQRSHEASCSHILFLDQDSSVPPGMVQELLAAEMSLRQQGELVAAVGPLFIDEKTGEQSHAIRHAGLRVMRIPIPPGAKYPVETDYLISSGSLISSDVLKTIGLMKDELFIDWVDIEWGLRAKRNGYKSFICPRACMRHSIGDDAVNFNGRAINLHSDLRNYYIVRNAVFLIRSSQMGWQWRAITAIKIPQYVVFYSLQSKTTKNCLLLLGRAIRDGLSGRLGKLT
jgi:rhamnosyltransferase